MVIVFWNYIVTIHNGENLSSSFWSHCHMPERLCIYHGFSLSYFYANTHTTTAFDISWNQLESGVYLVFPSHLVAVQPSPPFFGQNISVLFVQTPSEGIQLQMFRPSSEWVIQYNHENRHLQSWQNFYWPLILKFNGFRNDDLHVIILRRKHLFHPGG